MGSKVKVVNKPGGAGAEGYLHVKGKAGDSHTLLITLSSIFTLPVAMKTDFHWSQLSPVSLLALDEFILWVHADTPYKTAKDYLAAARSAKEPFKMGGTGAAQEDQVITIMLEQAANAKFQYVSFKGGGAVAKALAAKEVDSTVNNPSEAYKLWKEGRLRPLGLFDVKRLKLEWYDKIQTMREQGLDIDYLMMRGIFAPPNIPKEALDFYVNLLKKAYKSVDFQEYLDKNALRGTLLSGSEFSKWLGEQDELHKKLLTTAGLSL